MKTDTRKIAKAFIHDRQKQRDLNNLMKRFVVSLFFREKSLTPTTTSKPSYTRPKKFRIGNLLYFKTKEQRRQR
jgi:hypothetical protein